MGTPQEIEIPGFGVFAYDTAAGGYKSQSQINSCFVKIICHSPGDASDLASQVREFARTVSPDALAKTSHALAQRLKAHADVLHNPAASFDEITALLELFSVEILDNALLEWYFGFGHPKLEALLTTNYSGEAVEFAFC